MRVLIGDITLGAKPRGQPTPILVEWRKKQVIAQGDTPPDKPKTQLTIKNGLWECTMRFSVTTDTVKQALETLDGGPHWIETDFHDELMYLDEMTVTQEEGHKEVYQKAMLRFVEVND